jgi:hypothetical protein
METAELFGGPFATAVEFGVRQHARRFGPRDTAGLGK